MTSTLEVLFSPTEYQARRAAGFGGTVCVVFDVLRATSVMLTGLAHGAKGFIPVEEISEAIALRARHPDALLAGERAGLRITAAQSGGVDFDLGNSPREYTPEKVRDRIIVTATTNGTRALRACASADVVAVASFLNLAATAKWIAGLSPRRVALICAGTAEAVALEDVLGAGALCAALNWPAADDSAVLARQAFLKAETDLAATVAMARNARRLLADADLREDVPLCLRRDVYDFAAGVGNDGVVRKLD